MDFRSRAGGGGIGAGHWNVRVRTGAKGVADIQAWAGNAGDEPWVGPCVPGRDVVRPPGGCHPRIRARPALVVRFAQHLWRRASRVSRSADRMILRFWGEPGSANVWEERRQSPARLGSRSPCWKQWKRRKRVATNAWPALPQQHFRLRADRRRSPRGPRLHGCPPDVRAPHWYNRCSVRQSLSFSCPISARATGVRGGAPIPDRGTTLRGGVPPHALEAQRVRARFRPRNRAGAPPRSPPSVVRVNRTAHLHAVEEDLVPTEVDDFVRFSSSRSGSFFATWNGISSQAPSARSGL